MLIPKWNFNQKSSLGQYHCDKMKVLIEAKQYKNKEYACS